MEDTASIRAEIPYRYSSCTRPGLVPDMSRTMPKCPIFAQKGPLSMGTGHFPDLLQVASKHPTQEAYSLIITISTRLDHQTQTQNEKSKMI